MKASDIIDIPVSLWKKIGGGTATRIVQGSDKGKDKDGGNFPPYTAKYAERKAAGKASPKGVGVSRQISPPNLRLTGEMLGSITSGNATKTGVDIILRDGLKIEGNAKRGRDIYGISPDNASEIEKILADVIGKNIGKYASIPIEIKIG